GSLAAISRLQELLPRDRALPRAYGFAREHVAERSWRWLAPREVIELRRKRSGDPLALFAVFVQMSPSQMRELARWLDPNLVDTLPEQSSREAVAIALHQAILGRGLLPLAC